MILIVDDDEAGRYAIARKLTARGHLTAESTGGEDALRVLDTMAPAPRLVLLDWYMPLHGGAETLQAIRSSPRFKNLPVVVFSAACSKQTNDAALAAGANECVAKDAPDFTAICGAAAHYAPPSRNRM